MVPIPGDSPGRSPQICQITDGGAGCQYRITNVRVRCFMTIHTYFSYTIAETYKHFCSSLCYIPARDVSGNNVGMCRIHSTPYSGIQDSISIAPPNTAAGAEASCWGCHQRQQQQQDGTSSSSSSSKVVSQEQWLLLDACQAASPTRRQLLARCN